MKISQFKNVAQAKISPTNSEDTLFHVICGKCWRGCTSITVVCSLTIIQNMSTTL